MQSTFLDSDKSCCANAKKRELLMEALKAEKPVHVLLIGEVSSAKTLFLTELARLPGAEYLLGSSLTRAGIYDLMFEKMPRYLIIDEIDKVQDQENLSALLSLMETGILSETKYKRRRIQEFDTRVFAGANYESRIAPDLLSRFGAFRLYFRPYTPDEYVEVATKVLVQREGAKQELALYIAKRTFQVLNTRDVRVARSVARTAKTREDVDYIIGMLERER